MCVLAYMWVCVYGLMKSYLIFTMHTFLGILYSIHFSKILVMSHYTDFTNFPPTDPPMNYFQSWKSIGTAEASREGRTTVRRPGTYGRSVPTLRFLPQTSGSLYKSKVFVFKLNLLSEYFL